MNIWRVVTAMACLKLGSVCAAVSSVGPGYTAGSGDQNIYLIDLQTGADFVITTIPGSNPADIALLNKNTAYVLGNADGNIYSINLQNNTYSKVTPIPLPVASFLYDLALGSDRTAYVTGQSDNTIYSVDLNTGAYSAVATIPGNPVITDIAMLSSTTAYTVGGGDNNIYFVDLESGLSSFVANIPGNPTLAGIALSTSTTAYVVGDTDGTVRVVDLNTGVSSIVTTIAGPTLLANAAINDTTLYTVDSGSSVVYAVNLLNGQYSALASFGALLNGMAILLQMPTNGLHGNNTKLANYLNNNGTIDQIRSFALLPSGLAQALESVAPTRNSYATYAAQNGFLGASQVVSTHLEQRRFQRKERGHYIAAEIPTSQLLVSNNNCLPVRKGAGTVWFTPFGNYLNQEGENETVSFNLGLGGALLGGEYARDGNIIGSAAAYAFTHVNEKKDAGDANVNQGLVTLYGAIERDHWYVDMGIWGGYYHIENRRHIYFPSFNETAHSSTHGWQTAFNLEFGYEGSNWLICSSDSFSYEPFAMGEWVANWERGFHEHGAGIYNVIQKGRFSSLLWVEAGLKFCERISFCWGELLFREKASYAYQKAFHTGTITAAFIDSPGSFTLTTLRGAKNLGVVEFSMLFTSANLKMPYVDVRAQGAFGKGYQSYQVALEIGKNF